MLVKQLSRDDVEACVKMYLPHDSWIKGDYQTSLKNLFIASKRAYVRAIKEDNKVIAFLYAEIIQPAHLNYFCLKQMYFCSIGGISGVKAMFDLHDDLIKYAEEQKVPLVLSPGSHLDEQNKFARLLEKRGWERRGYMAAYKTSHFK